MTPKEKYQDIDASASVLPEKALIALKELKPVLFDKKYQTQEYSDTRKKAEEKMDILYSKISKDYPDAIKSKVAKQPEPKTPQAMAQKAAKQTIKQPTVKNPKATAGANNRGNVTKLAKEIRKDGETWHAAMKRAGEMINKEKGKAVKKANVQYEKLKAFLAKNPSIEKTMVTYGKKPNQGTRPLDVKRDAARVAKPKGKRVSSEGKTYYEYRANRTDSSRKRYPYLELGGKLFGAGYFAKGGNTKETYKLEISAPNSYMGYDYDSRKGKTIFSKEYKSKEEILNLLRELNKHSYYELQGYDSKGNVRIAYNDMNLYEVFEDLEDYSLKNLFALFRKDNNLSHFKNNYDKCVKWAISYGLMKNNKKTPLFVIPYSSLNKAQEGASDYNYDEWVEEVGYYVNGVSLRKLLKKYSDGGEFGHTYNGAGKFEDGGYLPKGANYQSYTPQGEDYEYRNFFGIEQGDFEKIVDVWHQDENNHAKYGNVYDKTISDMEAKYGFDKIDAVISHIEDVHNLHKMYHEDYFAKGGKTKSKTYKVKIYSSDYPNTFIMEKTFTDEKSAVDFAYSVDDMNDDGLYAHLYGFDSKGNKLVTVKYFNHYDEDKHIELDDVYVASLPKTKDCTSWQVDLYTASEPKNKLLLSKKVNTLRKAARLASGLTEEPLYSLINGELYEEYEHDYFAKGGKTKSTGIGRIEPQRNINSTELFDLRYGDVFEITKKDHTASSEYYIFLEFSDKHDVSIKAIRFPELKGEFGNKETYINGVSDGDIRILSREEAGKMLLEYNINHKKFAHGGEFGHTYNGAGKFSEGGYMATGEDYEYYNKFGLEQSDFEKIVEVWHMHEKTPTVEVEKQYNMVLDAMEDKYGETKIDDVVDDIYHRHGLMKIMNYAKGGKTKSKTYKVKIYSSDYPNTFIMEKTFTDEKSAVDFAYSVDDMNDDGLYAHLYGFDSKGNKLVTVKYFNHYDEDKHIELDDVYVASLPKTKDCTSWQVDLYTASEPKNKLLLSKKVNTLRKAARLASGLTEEPLYSLINGELYEEYEHDYFAKGGKTNKGDNLPNTVEEYFAAMNNFSMRLGEAEANFANDNGASYQRILAERDEFFEKVKAKWYAELNEAEGNFAKDGGKSYEAALKKLEDARIRFAKGGKISDVKWSNDENKRLGIWLLTSVDGNKILKMSSNGMELEKNVMDYYNKKGSVAKMTYNEDADEGLAWVTFSDLYQEVQSVYAKGGTTKGHTKYVLRQDIIDAGESVPVGNTYVSSGVYEGRYNDDGSFEIKHNGKWHEAESIDWETYAKGGFIDRTKNKNKASITADFNNDFWVLETIFREKHNYLSGISQYLGIDKSLVKEKLDALVKKGWVRVEENTAKPHLNQYYVTEKGKNEYSKDKYWSYDIIKNKVEQYKNGELVDIVDVYGFNIYMNGAFRNMNGIYYDSRKEATQRAKEIIKLLQDVNYKEPRNFGLFAKGGEITPKVNSQIVERAKIIYADNNGSTKEDFDMAYHQAIREAGYNVEEFISTMKNIGADYGHEGDDYYAKGGKVKGRLSDTHKYVPNRMIQEIEVERRGKTSFIDGADILDGVYVKKGVKFAHGGSMPLEDEALYKDKYNELVKNYTTYLLSKYTDGLTRTVEAEILELERAGYEDKALQYKNMLSNPSGRNKIIEMYYNVQKNTANEWINYLNNSDYPYSFRYNILNQVLKYNYDASRNALIDRTNTTVRDLTQLNTKVLDELYDFSSDDLLRNYGKLLEQENKHHIEKSKHTAHTKPYAHGGSMPHVHSKKHRNG